MRYFCIHKLTYTHHHRRVHTRAIIQFIDQALCLLIIQSLISNSKKIIQKTKQGTSDKLTETAYYSERKRGHHYNIFKSEKRSLIFIAIIKIDYILNFILGNLIFNPNTFLIVSITGSDNKEIT